MKEMLLGVNRNNRALNRPFDKLRVGILPYGFPMKISPL